MYQSQIINISPGFKIPHPSYTSDADCLTDHQKRLRSSDHRAALRSFRNVYREHVLFGKAAPKRRASKSEQ